jgi:hypothetical protein
MPSRELLRSPQFYLVVAGLSFVSVALAAFNLVDGWQAALASESWCSRAGSRLPLGMVQIALSLFLCVMFAGLALRAWRTRAG